MKKKYRVVVSTGINAKCASSLVSIFNKFDYEDVYIKYENVLGDGKSILSLITLLIQYNSIIEIEIRGEKSQDVFVKIDEQLEKLPQKIIEAV